MTKKKDPEDNKPQGKNENNQEKNHSKSVFEKIFVEKKIRFFVIPLFAGYLGWAIWATTQMKEGLELTNLVSDSSYWRNYVRANTEFYNERGPIIQMVINNQVNYWEPGVETDVKNMLLNAQESNFILNDFNVTWVESYRAFLSFYPVGPTVTKAEYIRILKDAFLPNFPVFQNDIVFNEMKDEIIASRVYIQGVGSQQNSDQVQMMVDARKAASDSPMSALAFSAPFVFFEQYTTIVSATLQTCGIAVAAMFVVGLILIPHPLSSFLVTLTMLMILVGMTALMHVWGLTLSSITMIQIVLSIGFSVDFSSHVCHVFVTGTDWESSHEARAGVTLNKIGIPVLNSAISSILGVVLLAAAKSYIFRSFFQTMFLVITLGVTHALLFLPVLLSFIGPPLRCC